MVPWVRGGDLAPVSSLPTSYSSGANAKAVLSQGLRGCRNRAAAPTLTLTVASADWRGLDPMHALTTWLLAEGAPGSARK